MESKKKVNGMGTLSKGKDGYWRGKIMIGEDPVTKKIQYKSFCGKSKTAVESAMREFRLNGSKDREEKVKKIKYGKETVKESMEAWLFNVKKMQLKSESFRRLESTCKNHIYKYIGDLYVFDLTSTIIQERLINQMYKEKQSLSSIKKAKSAISDYYTYWRRKQIERTGTFLPNIIELIELPSSVNFKSKEIRALTDDEADLFIKELFRKKDNGTFYYKNADIINLLIQTGMRIGEALALTIDDYNPKEKSLTINKNIVETRDITNEDKIIEYGKIHIKLQDSVKTNSGRRKIPLNNSAILSLERLTKRTRGINPNIKFLAITEEMELLWPSNITRTINIIYKKIGSDIKGAHALRHTYATAMFNQKAEVKMVSSLLGHSGTQITSDIYIHCLQTMNFGFNKELKFKPYPEYLMEKGA